MLGTLGSSSFFYKCDRENYTTAGRWKQEKSAPQKTARMSRQKTETQILKRGISAVGRKVNSPRDIQEETSGKDHSGDQRDDH